MSGGVQYNSPEVIQFTHREPSVIGRWTRMSVGPELVAVSGQARFQRQPATAFGLWIRKM